MVLEKYLKINRREITHHIHDIEEIISNWKRKLKNPDRLKNFSREVPNYPDFQENFLKKILEYEYSTDWVYEDSSYTGEGRVEFTIIDNNNLPILFVELKGQNQKLDVAQQINGRRTPVQQAYLYAMSNDNTNWFVVFNYAELRIYNKFEGYLKEKFISFDMNDLTVDDLYYLILLLGKKYFKDQRCLDQIKKESLTVEKEITSDIYKLYHETRLILVRQIKDYNGFEMNEAIRYAQLILNRIIFMCFAEDRGLLPNQILEKTIDQQIQRKTIKKNRCSIWKEINYLFEDINEENKTRAINEYDGIIFKENLSFLKIPDLFYDNTLFKDLKQEHGIENSNVDNIVKKYQNLIDGFLNPLYYNFLLLSSFDFNTEIDIDILGHIFEQSLTDLDELQEDLDLEAKAKKSRDLRKKEGIYYTPEYITDYICRETIIPYLSNNNINTPEELIDEYDESLDVLEKKLENLKILDLACGSGGFLNKSIDILLEIHKLIFIKKNLMSNEDIKDNEDGIEIFFDKDKFESIEIDLKRKIAKQNLFGVDINHESVGITNLSLFLQTVRKDKKLPNLSENIKFGNSIIDNEDSEIENEVAERIEIFNWNENFNEILKEGFDIIIGNPPYIRREKIDNEIKPFLEKKFSTYHGNADLYCYFFEKALNLLKEGGFLGYISSNKWMKTDYGSKLRYLLNSYSIQQIIDFFELKVFKDASTEPAIIILKKIKEKNPKIKVVLMKTLDFDDFKQYVKDNEFNFDQNGLRQDSSSDRETMGVWNFTENLVNEIIKKMKDKSITLSEYIREDVIKMGIKTERNEIFRISREKRDELIRLDKSSEDIIKPIIVGTDIHQYTYEFKDVYLILAKEGIQINKYPAVKNYLEENKEELKERDSVKGDKWYELRPCQYYDRFENEKIVYIHTAKKHRFALDKKNHYLINNCYIISSSDKYLLAYLNSRLFEFYKRNSFVAFGDPRTTGRCKLDYNKMKDVPIIKIEKKHSNIIDSEVDDIIRFNEDFYEKKNLFLSFLKNNYGIEKVSNKLNSFWKLNNDEFLKEIKKNIGLSAIQLQEIFNLFYNILKEFDPLLQDIEQKKNIINEFIYNTFKINSDERIFIENFVK